MNICMHCGFIGNPEDFRKPKGKVCKKCYKKQRSEHRKKNRKEIAKKEKEYREKNREQIAERVSEYYQKNRDYIRQRRKNSYQENHEEELEKQRIRRRKRGILPWTEIKNLCTKGKQGLLGFILRAFSIKGRKKKIGSIKFRFLKEQNNGMDCATNMDSRRISNGCNYEHTYSGSAHGAW